VKTSNPTQDEGENRVLKRIFDPKRENVTKMENKTSQIVLLTIYEYYHNDQMVVVICGACNTYRKTRNIYRISATKPEGERTGKRPRRRWENNIKMVWKEQGCDYGQIQPLQDMV
jgi:hypothetical protein